jgi:hypothetical protein
MLCTKSEPEALLAGLTLTTVDIAYPRVAEELSILRDPPVQDVQPFESVRFDSHTSDSNDLLDSGKWP